MHLLLTQRLGGFLASVERWTRISQVIEFLASFNLLFCTNWIDTSLRRATVKRADDLLVTVCYGKSIDNLLLIHALAVQRPNESNPLRLCCDIVKPVFSTTLYDAAPVRERDVVRQPIDRSTLHWQSLVTWRGFFHSQNEQLWNGRFWREAVIR